VLFIGIGFIGFTNMLKSKHLKIAFVLIALFITLFFITTCFCSDEDSPVYGEELTEKLAWTESEIVLFENINNSYDGVIVADEQTYGRPFKIYLKRKKCAHYASTTEGNIDWEYMYNKLIIWRKISLTRPVTVIGYKRAAALLGNEFKIHLDENFSCIYNTGEARAYLGRA
jgi:hypothetical protein